MPLPAIALAGLAAGGAGYGISRLMGKKKGGGGTSYDPSRYYDRGAGNTFDANQIKEIYIQTLGREPNQREIDQFRVYVQNGDLGYQDIAEIVGGLPEAQNNMLREQTTDLEGRLAASDNAMLDRSFGQLQAQYRRLGRADSSGLASSFARSAGDLALSRQNALNNFYSAGLTGVRDSYLGRSEASRARGYDLSDQRTNYNRALNVAALGQAYNASREDKALEVQRRMASGQLLGTVAGAGLGAAVGGVPGAYVGGTLGSGLGANYGLLRR